MKTRFAPSPTGYIHLGNVRTALFNYLLAQSVDQGHFLLRIEDTDATRSSEALSQQLQEDLLWLGLIWDEGPGHEGGRGPYQQSQRSAIYANYYQQLLDSGQAYRCFCSDQTLVLMRKRQLSQGQPPRYTGVCRHLSAEQIAEKDKKGQTSTLRFRVPNDQTICFTDLVKGEQNFLSHEMGDFILRRSDGTAAFFFCNAIDDALMGVTHVLRGEDHLTNTPRQIMILQALGLAVPTYGHMSLIVGEVNGAPLSKREGSFSVKALREQGYLPGALQNYLARLGHTYENPHYMDLQTLSRQFSTKRLGQSAARYDETQLLYWQKQALATLNEVQFAQWLGEVQIETVPLVKRTAFMQLLRSNVAFPGEALIWADILFTSSLSLNLEAQTALKKVPPAYWERVLAELEGNVDFKTMTQTLQNTLNLKGKALFSPLRLALTGRLDGPELAKIYQLLDPETLRTRILHAKNL
jgi:nondiscriminating glutamyl-tRNA synthetase